MKAAKPRTEAHERKRSSRANVPGKIAIIPPAARRPTAAALLKHALGWTGNDLQDVIAIVQGTRTKTRF
jgi:hypothetical protein